MTTPLRTHLAAELARKVQRHGLVVWDDDAREYEDVAATVCPPDTRFARWDGSWYALRREVESDLTGTRAPRLVVYVPTQVPAEDPLAELREAGVVFKVRLPTLLKSALAGQLTIARIDELGRQAATIRQAEVALTAGGTADARLIDALGTSDTHGMVFAVLDGSHDAALDGAQLWPLAAGMLGSLFGGQIAGTGEAVRRAVARQMVLTELDATGVGIPPTAAAAWTPPDGEQRRRTLAALAAWRNDRRLSVGYATLADAVQRDLGLESGLLWSAACERLDCLPAIEGLALVESVRQLDSGDFAGAADLARQRLVGSIWVTCSLPAPLAGAEYWQPRWRAVAAIARLRAAVAASVSPSRGMDQLLAWYATHGYLVDQAHRYLEVALHGLDVEGDLAPAIHGARRVYEDWLDGLLRQFSAAADKRYDIGDLPRQTEIHRRFVEPGNEPTAYIWVDALRYELGADLADSLKGRGAEVDLVAAVASAPTVTPVGMVSLCPGADTDLAITLAHNDVMAVSVGGTDVKGVKERESLLRAAHGRVVNLTLSQVFASGGERQLQRSVADAQLVLVRSQELDAAGESGLLAVTWPTLDSMRDQIVRAVTRLASAGIHRVVIAADHGFIALSRALPASQIMYGPGGKGWLSRRSWVGQGGTTPDQALRLPLGDTGVRSDLDLVTPRGLALFNTQGTRYFFHGGLSPQELVVPVIVCQMQPPVGVGKLTCDIAVAGGRILTGTFAVSVRFEPDLLTETLETRLVVLRTADQMVAARLLGGDGHNPVTGTVTLQARMPAVLTFLVTADLDPGRTVTIQLLDAGTDRLLAAADVTVAAPVHVEDRLD